MFLKHKVSCRAGAPLRATRPPRRAGRRGGRGRRRRRRRASRARAPARHGARRGRRWRRAARPPPGRAPAASGSSCDIGSSRSNSCGSSASADARQTRCSSPPESSTVFRPQRWSASTDVECALDPGPDLGGRDAEVLEPESDLVRDDRHHDLVLGVLEDRRDRAGELGRACAARVEPRDDDPARKAAAVEVRDEPCERAEQRRLAGSGRAEQRDDLVRARAPAIHLATPARPPGTRTRGRRR